MVSNSLPPYGIVISIIIPTHNSAGNIGSALKEITQQSFGLFEVLIIDNLSTDHTVNIIKEYYGNDKRIKIHSGKDDGIYDAMNKGICLAQGKWIFFMGDDDRFYDENVLGNVAKHLTGEFDIVYGDVVWTPENIKEEGEWTYPVFIHRNINHQRIFYNRNLFGLYGNYNTKYLIGSDQELNIRFFCQDSIRKKYIPLTIAWYHSGGFSAKKTDEAFWKDWDKIVFKNFKPYLPEKIIYSSLGAYCRYNIDKKRYGKAFRILLKVFTNTLSVGFVKLMGVYFIKNLRRNVV